MEETLNGFRVVRLLKNHQYPTYQLHAFMANRKTDLQAGLRLAALVTLDWVRHRLGDSAPEELQKVPDPGEYRTADSACLRDIRLDSGFVVDIQAAPEQGYWCLQINEPDLGSDPGNPEQVRPAVPGRVIQTNVEYRITGGTLECGFQTVVSDPEGVDTPAEVYRLAIIKKLANHPDFGLRQVTVLAPTVTELATAESLKSLAKTLKDPQNHLPSVVFTFVDSMPNRPGAARLPSPEKVAGVAVMQLGSDGTMKISARRADALPVQLQRALDDLLITEPPYDMESFARTGLGYCRVYLLRMKLSKLNAALGCKASQGDVIFFPPAGSGEKPSYLKYYTNATRQKETMDRLTQMVKSYPRGRLISFGKIRFLNGVREDLITSTADALQRADQVDQSWAQKISSLTQDWKQQLQAKDTELQRVREQLQRGQEYQARLEEEKGHLREMQAQEIARRDAALEEKDETITYLRRCLDRPDSHNGVASWVEKHFQGRLLLLDRAVSELEKSCNKSVDLGLICDALDFLSTDYWDHRYMRIPEEEMHLRCSDKYGRPFDLRPNSPSTMNMYYGEYYVRYGKVNRGTCADVPLDWHLCVGNNCDTLLRIYFFHDDRNQLIVVGSLPRHLHILGG